MKVSLWLRQVKSLVNKAQVYHVTPSRFAYWVLSRYSFLTAGSRCLGLPSTLWVEVTNACNLQCLICPTGSGTLNRSKAHLNYAQFKQIVDELEGSLMRIVFSGYGEPLLNPEIYDMIAYAHKYRIFTEMYTNLLLPDDDALHSIIESRVDLLVVAIDLAPEGQNWRYVHSTADNIARVKDRLIRLAELKQAYHSALPIVRISYPITRNNALLLDQAWQFAQLVRADEFLPKSVNAMVAGKNLREVKEKYVPEKFDRYSRVKIGSGRCHWPYSAGLIYANGDFAPCCYLARGEHILGNIFEQGGVRAVWNSKEYQNFRNCLMHNPESVPYCAQCVERFDTI